MSKDPGPAERWLRDAHAMQSGVLMEMDFNPKPTQPKHLRAGVNAAQSDHGGLARLLIKKGLITQEEYLEAIAETMKEEKEKYEKLLSDHIGTKVTLA